MARLRRFLSFCFQYWWPSSNLGPVPDYEKEFPDVHVKYLVLYVKGSFIVAIDHEFDLDWETTDAYDQSARGGDRKRNEMARNEMAKLEIRVGKNWPCGIVVQCKRMIGEGLARAYGGQNSESIAAFSQAERFIAEKTYEVSRYWTLLSAFLFTCGIEFVGVSLVIFRDSYISCFGGMLHSLLLAACLGSLGAFLSLLIRLGRAHVNSDAGLSLHIAEGGAKIAAGGICGFLMGLLIYSGVVLSSEQESARFPLLVLSLSMLSGMSERWIPGLLDRITAGTATMKGTDGLPCGYQKQEIDS